MPHDKKTLIERKLKRMSGMSADKIEAMHTAASTQLHWVRCWSCGTNVTATRNELKTCSHCGVNLWSRHG